MIRWAWVMASYRAWLVVVCLVGGCWREELIDDTFTEDEWSFLQQELTLPNPTRCIAPDFTRPDDCNALATFGQALFFSPKIAGPVTIVNASAEKDGKLACASCHAPDKFFIDTRSVPPNLSVGSAGITRHNALSLVNDTYKLTIVTERCAATNGAPFCATGFAWAGNYAVPSEVVVLAEGKAAMNTTGARMAIGIRSDPSLKAAYESLAKASLPDCTDPTKNDSCTVCAGCDTAEQVQELVGQALEAYILRLESVNAPLDRYVAGDHSALSAPARRGLALFIGKAMCAECHRGPLLSDLAFHNTGVPQTGDNVPTSDAGATDPKLNNNRVQDDALTGNFLTAQLRNVASTAPYMHAGQFMTLRDVVEFYRAGGVSQGFQGRKDPRIQPLDLTDDEALDLETFLAEGLGGDPIPSFLQGQP